MINKRIKTEHGVYELLCKCGNKLLDYKKERSRSLRYCYFQQIITEQLKEFQSDLTNTNPDRVKILVCRKCHYMIGKPVTRKGKLAFQLREKFYIERKRI